MHAPIDLKIHVAMLKNTYKELFEGRLRLCLLSLASFLNQRIINIETGKSNSIHKRLRNEYRSLTTNITWLFKWYNHIKLNIPNTTNMNNGHFSDFKKT